MRGASRGLTSLTSMMSSSTMSAKWSSLPVRPNQASSSNSCSFEQRRK